MLVLVAIALAVYGQLLEPGQVPASRHSDLVGYGWPVKDVLYDALHEGRGFPFWRSDQFSGNVALTQPQSLYTYPFHVLYWVLPPLKAVGPTFWFELLMAGVGAYVLGAALHIGRAARLLMAVAHLTSFKLMTVVYAGWVPVLPALSLLPWLLAALFHFTERRTLANALLLAMAAALGFHVGTLQHYYYAGLFFTPGILALGVSSMRRGQAGETVRLFGGIVAAGLLGFAVSAYLWLPILTDVPLLSRGQLPYKFFLSHNMLELPNLWTLLNPEALGTPFSDGRPRPLLWENVMYFGWLPLALALIGVVAGRPRGLARYLALVALTSVLIAFDTPLVKWLYEDLPGFALVRIPTRVLFLTGVVVVTLAGLGADVLLAALTRRGRRSVALVMIACLSLMVGEAIVRSRRYVETVPTSAINPQLPVAESIDRSQGPYRVMDEFPLAYPWCRSLGLEIITGYDPYSFAHYRLYLAMLSGTWNVMKSPGSHVLLGGVRRLDMLDALNVRYILRRPSKRDPASGWREVGRWPEHPAYRLHVGVSRDLLALYERRDPLARVFFVDRVVTVGDSKEAIAAIVNSDLRSTAVVEADAPITQSTAPGDSIRNISASPGSLHFSTHTRRTRFAVVSEIWHPGWRAILDDQPASLQRTDYALLGLEVPPGDHRVQLSFTPPAWQLGVGVSLAGLTLLAGLAVAVVRRR
jgi:hypothetical protein